MQERQISNNYNYDELTRFMICSKAVVDAQRHFEEGEKAVIFSDAQGAVLLPWADQEIVRAIMYGALALYRNLVQPMMIKDEKVMVDKNNRVMKWPVNRAMVNRLLKEVDGLRAEQMTEQTRGT